MQYITYIFYKFDLFIRNTKTHRVFITGLCGRPKNSKRELAVTVSHMLGTEKYTLYI